MFPITIISTYTENHCMYDEYGLINLKKRKKKVYFTANSQWTSTGESQAYA